MKHFLVCIVLFALQLSCIKTNITEPEPEPGRRDYVWTLDTLHSPFNFFTGLWGASPDDVWSVGGGGDGYDRLQHFDGKKWTPYNKEYIACGGESLWGSSKDDIWMVGSGQEGKIWHLMEITGRKTMFTNPMKVEFLL